MTILRVAYFHLCSECGEHGHIVLPDGSSGKEVGTKKDAFDDVNRLRGKNEIADDEAEVLKALIAASPLADHENMLSELLRAGQEIHEVLERMHDDAEEDKPPKYLH